jgi:hypothetical protein
MKLKHVTVAIDYRYDAGQTVLPRWKALRARIRQETGIPEHPYVFGEDLFKPTKTDVNFVMNEALLTVMPWTESVTFVFDKRMGKNDVTWEHGTFSMV